MKGYLSVIAILLLSSCAALDEAELKFQNDADMMRLEHLVYWTGLIEEYASKQGTYPFQSALDSPDNIGLVNIATRQQQSQLEGSLEDRYTVKTMGEFIAELESVLGRTINEMYDIQAVAVKSPVGYNYFFTGSGYLFRTTCITCGATEISPLLPDGITPVITVASSGMKGQVQGALTRAELISHPLYLTWSEKTFFLEEHVRSIVADHLADARE